MTPSSPAITESRRRPAGELIALTGVSPRAALAAARAVLAGRPGPREASLAHQAAAIVLRDFGDVRAAIREFRLAVRLARAAADPDREADVLTSLGAALVMAGRTEAGLAALDDALARVGRPGGGADGGGADDGAAGLGRILVRRGGSLHIAGRYAEARADLRKAITLTHRAGDTLWEARARTAAALADLAMGAVDRAEAGLAAAEPLFAGTGQRLEIAYARHNRALVAFASGDLPGALRHLDDAAGRYAELGVAVPDAALDRCAVLLAAGLPADALVGVEAALLPTPAGRLTATKKAELLLAAARIALAAGRHDQAAERSAMARSMFTAQRREWWRTHATLVLLQARFLARRPPARLLPEARRTAARLSELRSDEAPDAWLLAGRIALAAGPRISAGSPCRGDPSPRTPLGKDDPPEPPRSPDAEADRLLGHAARAAHRRVPAFARATGWLAEALRAEALGSEDRRLLAACRRGSPCSRSTWPRWARPSSGRTPPRTAPSSPGSPSGPRCAPADRACYSNGASAGGPSPSSPRARRPRIPGPAPSSRRCATRRPGWSGPTPRIPVGFPPACCTASGCGWKPPSGRAPCGRPRLRSDPRRPSMAAPGWPRPCWLGWATPGCSSSWWSTVTCTCWCAATAGSAAWRRAPRPRPPGRWTSPGSG